MIFTPTALEGAFLIEFEPRRDSRGFFARSFCQEEFRERGLDSRVAQCSVSFNQRSGTLRGLHWQAQPHAEVKLVRCTAGAVQDVIVDLRPESPTFRRWIAVRLDAQNRAALYIPERFAHGFLTLEEGSELLYQMSVPHRPDAARGARFDDPAFGIEWPAPPTVIAEKDLAWPSFDGAP